FRRQTIFAMAGAKPSPLIILNEPTNDIDASRRRLLWDAVRRRGDLGSGVLLVTHNVAEAERFVDELVILDRGRVVAEGSPARLRGTQASALRLEVHFPRAGAGPSEDVRCPAVLRGFRSGRRPLLTVAAAEPATAAAWATARHADDRVDGFCLAPATLEDAYLAHTAAPAPGADTAPD